MRYFAVGLAVLLLAPATASAAKAEDTFFNSVIPSRVDHLIGFTPTTFAIHPVGKPIRPITVRVGGKTHRYIFGNAAAVVGPSAGIYMRNMIRQRRYPSPKGIFLDRRLTASTSASRPRSARTSTWRRSAAVSRRSRNIPCGLGKRRMRMMFRRYMSAEGPTTAAALPKM